MKKCPFRKSYYRDNYNLYGSQGFPAFDYIEDFQECIEEECMAFTTKEILPYPGASYYIEIPFCMLMEK